MKLGMPALVEFSSLEENIELCKKLELDFIELNMDLPYCLPENNNLGKIKNENNIDFTVHLSEKLQVGEIHEKARKAQIEIIKDSITNYKDIANIKKYNIHFDKGVYFNMPDEKIYIFEKYKEKFIDSVRKSLEELSAFCEEKGVELYFENTTITDFLFDAFNEVKKYKNLFYTLDIGHDAKDHEKASKFFMKTPNMIKHMHIHDFNGEKNHIELGKGNVDIFKYLNFCEENNIYGLIEVKRKQELINSINYIKGK